MESSSGSGAGRLIKRNMTRGGAMNPASVGKATPPMPAHAWMVVHNSESPPPPPSLYTWIGRWVGLLVQTDSLLRCHFYKPFGLSNYCWLFECRCGEEAVQDPDWRNEKYRIGRLTRPHSHHVLHSPINGRCICVCVYFVVAKLSKSTLH